MKTYSKEKLETMRPDCSDRTCVEHCLTNLYDSKTLSIHDYVTPGLTYEELIGALILARDAIDQRDNFQRQLEAME